MSDFWNEDETPEIQADPMAAAYNADPAHMAAAMAYNAAQQAADEAVGKYALYDQEQRAYADAKDTFDAIDSALRAKYADFDAVRKSPEFARAAQAYVDPDAPKALMIQQFDEAVQVAAQKINAEKAKTRQAEDEQTRARIREANLSIDGFKSFRIGAE